MNREKIDAKLLEGIESSDKEYITVYIIRKDNVRNELFNTLLGMGFNYRAFEGYEDISDDERKRNEQYLYRKRKLSFDMYTKSNGDFLRACMGDNYIVRTVYMSHYTATCIAELTKNEIYDLSDKEEVENIILYSNSTCNSMGDDITVRQIGADDISGTASSFFNLGNGYRGRGISVGNISAGYYVFEKDSPQIRNKNEGGLVILPISDTTPRIRNFHSTAIVSQIVGDAVNVGGVIYEGIVPEATLYFTPTSQVAEVYIAIEKMLDYGVYIINYSAGRINDVPEYSAFDLQMDILIANQNFTFVAAAGNVTNITNPGLSYNAVTVGNVVTKIDDNTASSPPYDILCNGGNCSGYVQAEYLTNKPDICAPGVYISYAGGEDRVISRPISGTSFAAPYVASVAAQMMQANGYMNFLPLKSALLLGANFYAITEGDNPTVPENDFLRIKTGAGFLDAVGAVRALDYENITSSFNESKMSMQRKIILGSGEGIRAVLCFEKNDNVILRAENQNSVILILVDEQGNTLAQSRSSKDNIHIIEYMSLGGGEYELICAVNSKADNVTDIRYSLSYKIS